MYKLKIHKFINIIKSSAKLVHYKYIHKIYYKTWLLEIIKWWMESKRFHHISLTKIHPSAKLLHSTKNVTHSQNTLTVLTLRWRRIFLQDVWMGQMRMTDANTIQDNFILPAPPVGGLPISQNWMKLVRDRTLNVGQNCTSLFFFRALPFQEGRSDHTVIYGYMASDIW